MSCLIHHHTRSVPRANSQSAPDAFAKGCVLEPPRERPATAFLQSAVGFGFLPLFLFLTGCS